MCITNGNFSRQFIILLSKRKTTFLLMLSVDINSVSILDEEKGRTILKDINFEIEKGKVYTILGKNGSGKSTLVKSLTSLLPKIEYEVNGRVNFSATGGSTSGGNGTDLLNSSEEKLR